MLHRLRAGFLPSRTGRSLAWQWPVCSHGTQVSCGAAFLPFPCVGVDGRGHPDLLLLCHLCRVPDSPEQLQQVQQQLLQVTGSLSHKPASLHCSPRRAGSGVTWREHCSRIHLPHPSLYFPILQGYQLLEGAHRSTGTQLAGEAEWRARPGLM